MEYITDSGIYDVYQQDIPHLGQGKSFFWLFNQVQTKYILNIEDDWRLLKDIDLNKMVEIMETNADINQITFNKRPIMKKKQWFEKKEIERNGVPLVTNMYWTMIPSLWRVDWIKSMIPDNLVNYSGGQFSYGINRHISDQLGRGLDQTEYNADWIIKNTGTYFLGNIIKNHKALMQEGKITEEQYLQLDNGMYFQHLGYRPYEPEKWIWPLIKPNKIKTSNMFKMLAKCKDGTKWNPTKRLDG